MLVLSLQFCGLCALALVAVGVVGAVRWSELWLNPLTLPDLGSSLMRQQYCLVAVRGCMFYASNVLCVGVRCHGPCIWQGTLTQIRCVLTWTRHQRGQPSSIVEKEAGLKPMGTR